MTKREDMEKAFPPVFSNLNLVVVAGDGPVEKCRTRGQQATASGVFCMLFLNFISHPKNGLDVGGVLWVRLQLVPQAPDRIVHGVSA